MVGQNIGKYQVLDRIGRGGMGTVFRAMDETLRREVAIKILNAELNDPAVAKRFHAEAITVARLNHPGIATVYELFQNDGQWLMVMEFVRGETLEALVTRRGPLPLDEAADISMQALGALAHAHSLGVVHRDLKPANLMFGDSGLVKIMDFGIARVAGTEHLTSAGFMMGTPAYMAPEQVLGEDIDARCDIYAMGAVLFYLLTGQLPFKGKSPFEMAQAHLRDQPILLRTTRLDMPEWAEQVIDRALQREPQKRFQSAPLFHDALRRGLSGLPIDAAPAAPVSAEVMVTAPPGGLPLVSAPATADPSHPTPELMETVLASSPPAPVPVAPATVPLTAPPVDPPTPAPGSAVTPETPPAETIAVLSGAAAFGTPDARESGTARTALPLAGPSAPAAAERPTSRAPLLLGAIAVLVIAVGVFAWTRGRDAAPPAAVASNSADVPSDTAATPAPTTPTAPPASELGAGATTPSTDNPAPPVEPAPASRVDSGTPATAPGPGGRALAPAREGRGVSRAEAPVVSAPAAAVPSSTAPPETFADVRLLVINGKKADERPVSLRFADGAVAAVSPRDGTVIASIADATYAAYVRAKDPYVSPALASPPADTDFPGGLFGSGRHWLTLQSRSSFLIFRLNDADWRRIIDAVNRRTTVKVATPAPASK